MFGDDGRGSTATVPPPPRTRLGRRSAPADTSPQGLPTRRRWGRFAAGAVLALLGAWVFATLYVSAGERVEVLAVARDVDVYDPIEDDDLRTVLVAADEKEVDTIDAGDRDDIVGRQASAPLFEGQLLTDSVLIDEDDQVMEPNEAYVAIEVSPSLAETFEPGQDVGVVLAAPPAGGTEEQEENPPRHAGWIRSISEPDDQTRTVTISVVVDSSVAARVAGAARNDRVELIGLEGFQKDG
jgi:hypothetical protein